MPTREDLERMPPLLERIHRQMMDAAGRKYIRVLADAITQHNRSGPESRVSTRQGKGADVGSEPSDHRGGCTASHPYASHGTQHLDPGVSDPVLDPIDNSASLETTAPSIKAGRS